MRFLRSDPLDGNPEKVKLESDKQLASLLQSIKTIALLGASARPDRPSNRVFRYLVSAGYRVIPVNPLLHGEKIMGYNIVQSLEDILEPIDMVDVFRDSRHLPNITESIIQLGIPALWTQLGVSNTDAESAAVAAGIRLVIDRCPAIEIPRLQKLGLLPKPRCEPNNNHHYPL